ncbi:hypothetical protein E2C01_047065 [Portunus trituberculatus]|uniref:Uncharacterized protein n=1 Tax=Portunus trituberculatus TaxID=210409 RepID=A0A5B7G7S7_PORTR|nr:hypothetical protein [Portunus trituberculatus]
MYSSVYIRGVVGGLAGTDSLPLENRFRADLDPWVMGDLAGTNGQMAACSLAGFWVPDHFSLDEVLMTQRL